MCIRDRAVRHADAGEQQAQVVPDLGDGADGRAGVAGGRLLVDRDGRRQALDEVDVGLVHLAQELAGVRRQRLDVPALALGATKVDVGQDDSVTWVVLADPEGNEFCILRALTPEELAS